MFQHTAARRRLDAPAISNRIGNIVSTHSRPKAAGFSSSINSTLGEEFQHTAARRRLDNTSFQTCTTLYVSTHSRPKAAGSGQLHHNPPPIRFNTQPPEGGWTFIKGTAKEI